MVDVSNSTVMTVAAIFKSRPLSRPARKIKISCNHVEVASNIKHAVTT